MIFLQASIQAMMLALTPAVNRPYVTGLCYYNTNALQLQDPSSSHTSNINSSDS